MALTGEKIHLRTAHSRCIGYWAADLGGLNQVRGGRVVLVVLSVCALRVLVVLTKCVSTVFTTCVFDGAPTLSLTLLTS